MTTRMRILERLGIAAAAGVVVFAVAFCEAQDAPPPAPGAGDQTAAADAQGNVQVLTSGPVHEAFADPVTLQAEQGKEGVVIATAPPEPIDELPPEAMPTGENVEWIPGYWAWDEDQDDFLWISGLWRNLPPDQRWIPGYWANVDRGHRWVSGFWTAADSQNLEYLPYPPATQEHGPNVPAPGEGYFWIPGSWSFASGEYQWRPGYWAHAHDDWCWIPQRYVWTPRGVLYSAGYWDYRLPYRGTLFAPVRFADTRYFVGGRRFTPGYVINPAGLLVNLFVRPNYGHYYFGNYYGDEYYQRGYRPWFDPTFGGHYHYDPLLAFYESYYDRRGIDFSGRVSQWYTFYERNPDRRPARTWSEAQQLAAAGDADTTIRIARPLEELVRGEGEGEARRNFRQLTSEQRTAFAQASTDFRDLVRSRGQVEVGADADATPDRGRQDRQPDASRDEPRRPGDAADPTPGRDPARPEQADQRPGEAASRGLALPQRERRAGQILGEGPDDRQAPPSDASRDRTDRSEAPQDRTERPGADRPGEPRTRQRGEIGPPAQRPQPPERPDRPEQPSAGDRTAPRTGPSARDERPGAGQPRQQQREGERPSRNMFQPRRGNFPDASQGADRGQRPQIDPRDAVPQFRGRGNTPQNQPQQPRGVQQRGRSGPPQGTNPPADNRGPANPGNRGGGEGGGTSNNRGGGNAPGPRDN